MRSEPRKSAGRIERGMARMQQVGRGVIDVDQNRIEAAARRSGIETM
jgi:hypothetical protein